MKAEATRSNGATKRSSGHGKAPTSRPALVSCAAKESLGSGACLSNSSSAATERPSVGTSASGTAAYASAHSVALLGSRSTRRRVPPAANRVCSTHVARGANWSGTSTSTGSAALWGVRPLTP